jgi:trk system potassium uptake protein TrkA
VRDFAIIGLGNFGAAVAAELKTMKCRVTGIDLDKARVQDHRDSLNTAILADATDRRLLENLEVDKFECFVVSTGENTDASILITLHLKELNAAKIIVKAKSSDQARILQKVGADQALIPEQQMAQRVARSLASPNLIEFLPMTPEYSIAELEPPKDFVGKSLAELEIRSKYHMQVIAVRDKESGVIRFAPDGNYRIRDTEVFLVLGRNEDIAEFK